MSDSTNSNVASDTPASGQAKEDQVSLAPACMVISLIFAVVMSVCCAIAAWVISQNEPEMAVKALEEQLIPWIEESSFDATDRESIVAQLREIIPQIKSGGLSKRQLARLRIRLSDSPILMWGFVQQVQRQVRTSEMTELEKETADRILERLLRMTADGMLRKNQLETAMQSVASKSRNNDGLEVIENNSIADLRQFVDRSRQLVETAKIPDEPYAKSPAQVFQILIQDALTVEDETQTQPATKS